MNERGFRELLQQLVEEQVSESTGEYARSFEESGMMTSNEGFVVRVGNQEFQVTVVRSR